MVMLKIIGLLISGAVTISARPLASVHVKFVSPPHVYEHALTTDDGNTVAQKYFFAVGQRNSGFNRPPEFLASPRIVTQNNAESLWPVGVFLAPTVDFNDLRYSSHESFHSTPNFSNGLEYDPFLLTGDAAVLAVKYLYGHGELFFHEIPHWRALITNQQMRRMNGLHEHILRSHRPTSPFYHNP